MIENQNPDPAASSPKLWGGRFDAAPDSLMEQFNASLPFDQALWAADIRGSQAYARALARAGLISLAERDQLLAGLDAVADEWARGVFVPHAGDEDIHTAVERRLGEVIGGVAGKLHTGRSRNDQVATDVRLWLRDQIDQLAAALRDLQAAVIALAEAHLAVLMPGTTHMQPAQPIRFSHWALSFFWMWQRDHERLTEVRRRVNVCPLGSGALAGTPFNVDRAALAAELGFDAISANSLDAVSDRDFVVEFLAWAALLGIHLSRLAEDLILWSNPQFGFVRVADAYSTGSSLMPQKRNPDAMELVRGKSGRLLGNLVSLLTTLKGLPSTYNKDLQEDKEPLFDTVTTLTLALPVTAGVLRTLQVNPTRMQAALSSDMLATDLADYLVRQGTPFRQAHHLVGQAVRRAEALGLTLSTLPLAELQAISPQFGADVAALWDFNHSVEQRATPGGTARAAVETQLRQARQILAGG
ncbi:MAG: argininosuccinate lyase [Anaerolineae bacterium]